MVLTSFLFLGGSVPSPAEEVLDFDEDGVTDSLDLCPDTSESDLAGPDGCTVVACDVGSGGSAWISHDAYVDYVAGWVKSARTSGLLRARAGRKLVRRARKSSCGAADEIRCCIYQDFMDDVGTCRVMTALDCDALDERLFEHDGAADDEGTGSCLPNPCVF